ncbi:MAG: YwaF family protein [Clostridia bacterium]|nr:YwaF family protein [Clostridia bacterium]
MPPANEYYFGYYFYAPQGRFEPCGMFTIEHIVTAIFCLLAVMFALVFLNKKKVAETVNIKIVRFFAVFLTILEVIKITHSFIYGDLHLDAWFPLSYCGLFIYALWMAGYGKGKIKRCGAVFISYGCAFAGLMFLIFPTTSLMLFPIWHYFSIYSLLFHSVMMFIGTRLLITERKFNWATYFYYFIYVLFFAIISITMNYINGCNLMNLREPYNIPIQLLQDIYNTFSPAYTIIGLIIYMLVPLLIAWIFGKFKEKKKEKSK